ncbi:hypothetical protein ACLOJK_035469 [Asimina triloba]
MSAGVGFRQLLLLKPLLPFPPQSKTKDSCQKKNDSDASFALPNFPIIALPFQISHTPTFLSPLSKRPPKQKQANGNFCLEFFTFYKLTRPITYSTFGDQ